jgi:hypothetical protein
MFCPVWELMLYWQVLKIRPRTGFLVVKIATSQDRLKMRDWRKTLKKPGMSGMREFPDNLYCSIPRYVYLKIFFTI